MKHCIYICLLLFPWTVLAQSTDTPKTVLSFWEHEANVRAYCDGASQEWSQYSNLAPIPQYPELESSAVNRQIERTPNLSNISDEERGRLAQELTMGRIGNFSEFKTLEVARLQYRSTMNSIFACAVIESRLNILTKIQDVLPTKNSEIVTLLKKEETSLRSQKGKLQCNSAGSEKVPSMQELVNSTTRQYCHYRYYLDYLDTALRTDKHQLEQIESAIGTGSGTKIPVTTSAWQESYQTYANALDKEIARADATLPRAIRAFRDMERAYPAHLMLVIIYDDYIRLRNNLSIYMNASTQLYMKAFNAQDENQR